MQTHITRAYKFLEEHLPTQYVEKTQKILSKGGIKVSDDVIRNVRTQKTTSNVDVLNALLLVAKAVKKKKEKLFAQLES